MWRKGNPRTLLVGMQTAAASFRKAEWSFLETLEMKLPFDPAIPLLGIFLKNSETPVQENICTAMFIAALFKTVKT